MSSPALTPPPGGQHFPLLDAVRGLCIAAVVLQHVGLITGELDGTVRGDAIQAVGDLALNLFFGLSGFLLYRPWVAARAAAGPLPSVRRYLRRRALRVLPAYWTALTLLAVFPGLVGVRSGDWWRFYLFGQIYEQRTFGQGIPPAWSLCVEATFYLALPVWAVAVRVTGRGLRGELVPLGLAMAASAAVLVGASQLVLPHLVGQSLPGQGVWIGAGMLLAVLSVHGPHGLTARVGARAEWCWALAAGCLAGIVALVPDGGLFANAAAPFEVVASAPQVGARAALTLVLVLAVLAPLVLGDPARAGWPGRLLSLRWLTWLGVVSYAMFLWHITLSELLGMDGDPAHFRADAGLDLAARVDTGRTLVLYAATMGASVAVAAASYRWVELPFLRRKEPRRPVSAAGRSAGPAAGSGAARR